MFKSLRQALLPHHFLRASGTHSTSSPILLALGNASPPLFHPHDRRCRRRRCSSTVHIARNDASTDAPIFLNCSNSAAAHADFKSTKISYVTRITEGNRLLTHKFLVEINAGFFYPNVEQEMISTETTSSEPVRFAKEMTIIS
ncbi:uncharacterized protein [Triticum aestivum]|uniref:uncharacterized protein n=1 Tax=Triticum aestivum TaxID=4565 RepID=UPI001D009290|nr:uncharacterized protein LOC123117450 [Triticum aestivum]